MEEEFKISEPDLTLAKVKSTLKPISWFLENNIPVWYYTHLDLLANYLAKNVSLPRILQRTSTDEIVSLLIKEKKKLEDYNKKLTNMFPGLYLGLNARDPNLIGPMVEQNAMNYIHGMAGWSPYYTPAMAGLGTYSLYKLNQNDKLGFNIPTAVSAAMTLPFGVQTGKTIHKYSKYIPEIITTFLNNYNSGNGVRFLYPWLKFPDGIVYSPSSEIIPVGSSTVRTSTFLPQISLPGSKSNLLSLPLTQSKNILAVSKNLPGPLLPLSLPFRLNIVETTLLQPEQTLSNSNVEQTVKSYKDTVIQQINDYINSKKFSRFQLKDLKELVKAIEDDDISKINNFSTFYLNDMPEDLVRNIRFYGEELEDVRSFLKNHNILSKTHDFRAFSEALHETNKNYIERMIQKYPFDDNPLINRYPDLSEETTIFPSEFFDYIVNPNPKNNQYFYDFFDAVWDAELPLNISFSSPELYNYYANYSNDVPVESAHYNMKNPYDGSIPLDHYIGSKYYIDQFFIKDKLDFIKKGLLPVRSNKQPVIGLYKKGDFDRLSWLDFLKSRSDDNTSKNIEGARGSRYFSGSPKAYADLLLTSYLNNRISMLELKKSIQNGYRSGLIISPHSLSLDSYPLWEKILLDLVKQGKTHLMNGTVNYRLNNFATNALYEPSKDLLDNIKLILKELEAAVNEDNSKKYLYEHKRHLKSIREQDPENPGKEIQYYYDDVSGKKFKDPYQYYHTYKDNIIGNESDTESRFFVRKLNDNNFEIIDRESGKSLGSFRQLSDAEIIENFNTRREELYKRFLGDNYKDYLPKQGLYKNGSSWYIPTLGGIVYKKGGKVNAKLVKKQLKKD